MVMTTIYNNQAQKSSFNPNASPTNPDMSHLVDSMWQEHQRTLEDLRSRLDASETRNDQLHAENARLSTENTQLLMTVGKVGMVRGGGQDCVDESSMVERNTQDESDEEILPEAVRWGENTEYLGAGYLWTSTNCYPSRTRAECSIGTMCNFDNEEMLKSERLSPGEADRECGSTDGNIGNILPMENSLPKENMRSYGYDHQTENHTRSPSVQEGLGESLQASAFEEPMQGHHETAFVGSDTDKDAIVSSDYLSDDDDENSSTLITGSESEVQDLNNQIYNLSLLRYRSRQILEELHEEEETSQQRLAARVKLLARNSLEFHDAMAAKEEEISDLRNSLAVSEAANESVCEFIKKIEQYQISQALSAGSKETRLDIPSTRAVLENVIRDRFQQQELEIQGERDVAEETQVDDLHAILVLFKQVRKEKACLKRKKSEFEAHVEESTTKIEQLEEQNSNLDREVKVLRHLFNLVDARRTECFDKCDQDPLNSSKHYKEFVYMVSNEMRAMEISTGISPRLC